MSRISRFRKSNPIAFGKLKAQLLEGNRFKAFGVKFLYELGAIAPFKKLPFMSDLIKTSEGLFAGHISDAELTSIYGDHGSMLNQSTTSSSLPSFMEVDTLIIGSGPGASIAAELEMAASPSQICVLERGTFQRTPKILHHTLTHVINDFYQAGQELVLAKGFPLFAQGSVVGGGSEVNSGLFHALPEVYRDKWASAFSIEVKDWLESEEQTFRILGPERMEAKFHNSLLARGAKSQNLVCENIPRWRSYLQDGTYIHRGMTLLFWNKQSVKENILMFDNSEAVRIDNSNSNFIDVTVRNTQDRTISVIRAKKIHLAAGAISTPVLLMKSKLLRRRDTNFAWHPMIRVVAKTRKSDLGEGDIDPFQAWTEDRSLKFGSAVSTAPLLSIALGRLVSLEEASELRSFYVSFSSSGKGGILPLIGLPWYRFSKKDRWLASRGLEMLKDIIVSGGGELINFENISSEKFSTVHIFGTLPINSEIFFRGTNMLKIDNRIRVSDASILPFGPGVNPQGVVMSSVRIANRDLLK
jgi:hypothetical protein